MGRKQAGTLAGKRLGKYVLDKRLGTGATSEVYLGRSKAGKKVAVKVLRQMLATDADGAARFKREAEIGKSLDHPNVVEVLDVGTWRGHYYIVMEYLRGGAFRRLIKKGEQPVKVITALAEVADALASAHEQDIVHRDLKPENVLLTRKGKAKVGDFGLARIRDTSLTTDGAMLGTVKYMSPEQARGEAATAASDVYSMGVMIYEAASGELPFQSVTEHGFIFQHAIEKPSKPALRRGFSPPLATLAMRCLAKNPEDRPPMAEVHRRLQASLAWRPRRWPMVAVVAGVAVAAALGVVVADPAILDPMTEGWFGAPLVRELRDAAFAVRSLAG